MSRLEEIMDIAALERLIASRHISRSRHPSQPLSIFDYTTRTQFDGTWTPETIRCRGLVVHDDGAIVARPLDKFFNLDEHPSTMRERLSDAPLEVTDKLDGSLVILRNDPDGPAASTRGSFLSEQALWATQWLRSRGLPKLDPGITLCAEFISPKNRIVLDYGEREDVVIVAARRIADGSELLRADLEAYARELGLPIVSYRTVDSLQVLLDEAQVAMGIEGWVVRFADGVRAKIKTPEYRRIHKLRCMLTPAIVRDALRDSTLDRLMMDLPEEMWPEIRSMAAEIDARVELTLIRIAQKHAETTARSDGTRKGYAALVQGDPDAKLLFMLLDGRNAQAEALRCVDLSGMERVWTTLNDHRRPRDE